MKQGSACGQLGVPGVPGPGSPACPRPSSWGGLLLGGPKPVIAVATTAADAVACAAQAQAAQAAGADLVELRADLLTACAHVSAPEVLVQETLQAAQAVTAATNGTLPVLLTFRTRAEGGGLQIADAAYAALLAAVLDELAGADTAVAAIDLELARGCLPELARLAAAHGLATLGSSHDFQTVPADAVLLERMRQMQAAGAQAAKVAVMPQEPQEVARLMALTAKARAALEVPVVVIGMGEVGALTRLQGWRMGSALTFATAGAGASAPGQLPVAVVRAAFETDSADGGECGKRGASGDASGTLA
ncbi:3-dehydroquinate dehydratase [Actinomyces bovis]|uniref:3-dehydroquinate dehydratase n=1 Tax=Actinomyces bovis TaxID=1658 RepID=A0ABY1VM11_9ACTO|nr:type I 3-dehydroquinate dehydratase [Actinomyces bovis]SPT53144.1 3-dehydroquinate dehydratase [Actinomyces bovis]VEG52311.1 3-dehydroquinate dehydratase [Actinomyces israelii]